PDDDPAMQAHGQHVARPDLVVGTGAAFGIDSDRAGLDELLRQRARLERAREEQEPVEPFLADGFAGSCQGLLRLAVAQGRQLGEGAVGIERLFALVLARALETGALALFAVGAAV